MEEGDTQLRVMVSEDCVQHFAAYPDINAQSAGSWHMFSLVKENGAWKISSHMDSLSYVFRQEYPDEIPQSEEDKESTLSVLQAEASAFLEDNLQSMQETVDTPSYDHPYDRDAALAYADSW